MAGWIDVPQVGDVAEFAYSGNGCINATGGTEKRLQHKVLLPQGATVVYLRLYAYDDSSSDVTAFFTSYDAAGNFTEHTYVSSTDAGGYVTVLSPSISYVVDPLVSPINVTVHLGDESSADTIFKNGFGDSSTLRFCGVRIAYTP